MIASPSSPDGQAQEGALLPAAKSAFRRGGRPREIFFNGRFLSQSLTGVQRYAAELIRAVDGLLVEGKVPASLVDARFTVLTPSDATAQLDLKVVSRRPVGRLRGHAWDQLDLFWAARGGVLASLANAGPVLHPRHLVVLHDAQVYRHPEFFSRSYLMLHRTLGRLLARRARLGTVSLFSQGELAEILELAPERLAVIPNGAEHMCRLTPDSGILIRLGLTPGRFFLALGTMNRNKNISLAVRAAALLGRPDYPLVVVGGGNEQVFGGGGRADGAIFAGRLSDEEIAALYAKATAFVFPSLYEGFGVPPLEAMAMGCPVLASTAIAVRETCGNAAAYFDPSDADALSRLMAGRIADDPPRVALREHEVAVVDRYNWSASAARLLDELAVLAH